MDIDEDEPVVSRTESSSTSTHTTTTHTNSSQHTDEPETTKITRKTKVAYSSTRVGDISFSPVGMAVSMLGEAARPAHDVQALLPDTRGIFHYHRPRAAGHTPGAMDIHALARSLAARSAVSAGGQLQRGSQEARERALQRVLRRISLAAPGLSPRVGLPRQDCIVQLPRARMLEAPDSSAIEEIKDDDDDREGDQWVSDDSDYGLAQEVHDMALRIRQRAIVQRLRRLGSGVSKSAGGVSKSTVNAKTPKTKTSLAAAYARFKTDDEAVQHTVREMGQGDADTVLQLIRAGVDVNTHDRIGRTALHVACSAGNTDTVRLLLHMGALANATDALGNTPLMLAATGARTDIVVPLLEAGADPRVGRGITSAMAMVRSRLRMLRTQMRHARTIERMAMTSESLARHMREQRQRTAAVAKECVDIIRLLRIYTQRQAATDAHGSNAAYDAYSAAAGETEPAILSDQSASQLDELSSQLMTLGLAADARGSVSTQDKGKMPETAPMDDHESSAPNGQFILEEAHEPAISESHSEDEMEQLLDRFAQLLGDE
ncbi:hypothetical protein IWW50_000040 [Coemansia erecta]|nr:hypothetical protein GGF43_000163 [Coemansia sp. RSA 2618]KAJ2830819.1 hypothetical protein IWW50_000040 [Coemansia erecta]